MRCWKHLYLNKCEDSNFRKSASESQNEDFDFVAQLDGNLKQVLRVGTRGLKAGGSTEKDLMDCPNPTQKVSEVCPNCFFSGEESAFEIV